VVKVEEKTYYSLLGVSESASTADIKTAYYRLMREVHPDRLANAPAYWQRQAEEKSKEINEAFGVLSNPQKRREYDAQLGTYRRSQGASAGTSTAPASGPPPGGSAHQHGQSPAGTGNNSFTNQQSTQGANSTQHHQATSTKTSPQNRNHELRRFFIVFTFGIVAILIAIAVIGSSNRETGSTSSSVPLPSAASQATTTTDGTKNRQQTDQRLVRISAAELLAAYQDDEAASNKLYKGKEVKVSGSLNGVFIPNLDIQMQAANRGGEADAFVTLGGPAPRSPEDTLLLPGIVAYSKQTEHPSLFGLTDIQSASIAIQRGAHVVLDCKLRNAMRVSGMVMKQTRNDPDFAITLEDCTVDTDAPDFDPAALTTLQKMTYGHLRELVNRWQSDTESYSLAQRTITFGNLSGTGNNDAVAVVFQSYEPGGGNGWSEKLVAAINKDGIITDVSSFDLGVANVKSIEIKDGVITVHMLAQGPNDPYCCPAQPRVTNLVVDTTNNKPVLKLQDKDAHPAPSDESSPHPQNYRVVSAPEPTTGTTPEQTTSSTEVPATLTSAQPMVDGAGLGSAQQDPIKPSANGLYRIGGGVSAPVPLISPEAEFTVEARRAKYQGVCLVSLIVDAEGTPQNPRVIRGLGMGLDEKALEAVRKYKFKPALKDGRTPVPVMITIEVNFRLY
jgi:TonB family protein